MHQQDRSGTRWKGAVVGAFLTAAGLMMISGQTLADEAEEDCRIDPDQESTQPLTADPENPDKISDCDGVLVPAPVGDAELVEPVPEAGTTPVIEPDDLPDQPPQN